jgi:hypothetical protein
MSCVRISLVTQQGFGPIILGGKAQTIQPFTFTFPDKDGFQAKCSRTIDGECWDAIGCPHSKIHIYNPKTCDQLCPDEDPELEYLFEKSWTDPGRHIIL